jgi:hypothetical protein
MEVMDNIAEATATVNFDQELTHLHDTRQVWREAVAHVAEKAKTALPESHGRIDKAVMIVLAGDVEMFQDGTARVASQSDGVTTYHVVNGHCDCKDFDRAPQGWCKHRLAHAISRRAYQRAGTPEGAADEASLSGVAEASRHAQAVIDDNRRLITRTVSQEHVTYIQDKPYIKYAGLLQMAHERGLKSLTATWTYNDETLSLATATATFEGGPTFTEGADATPANVNRTVAPHFRRVALTRAKARVLRDALGLDMVAAEELGDE